MIEYDEESISKGNGMRFPKNSIANQGFWSLKKPSPHNGKVIFTLISLSYVDGMPSRG
jgi:hypothetical protein